MLYKNCIFQCIGKIFCVEFQRFPLKFHTKYLIHTLKDVHFIHRWNFKKYASSGLSELTTWAWKVLNITTCYMVCIIYENLITEKPIKITFLFQMYNIMFLNGESVSEVIYFKKKHWWFDFNITQNITFGCQLMLKGSYYWQEIDQGSFCECAQPIRDDVSS